MFLRLRGGLQARKPSLLTLSTLHVGHMLLRLRGGLPARNFSPSTLQP